MGPEEPREVQQSQVQGLESGSWQLKALGRSESRMALMGKSRRKSKKNGRERSRKLYFCIPGQEKEVGDIKTI